MATKNTRLEMILGRRRKATTRSRLDCSETSGLPVAVAPLASTDQAALLNRLHKTWQSLPALKEAKVYSPLTTRESPSRNNRFVSPQDTAVQLSKNSPSTTNTSTKTIFAAQKLSPAFSSSLADFEKKYATDDPLMRYVLHVIRTGSSVIRSEIPRGKHAQRKVRPEEDVLYLVYCETPPCGFRNVYWLMLADEGTVLRTASLEYFTLGSRGITSFKDRQGVEFSDLASWVDEKRAFDHMTKMEGLDRIQQMIFFFSWKRQAVQRRVHRVRERLACSLFTCHPIAASLLMTVRIVCADIEHEAVRDYIDPRTSYTLEQFAQVHHDRVRAVKSVIANKIRALCAEIDRATRSISGYREGEGCTYALTDREAFSNALRLTSLRERMFTFLRLVDCHVSEAIFQHVTLVVQDVRAQICGSPSQMISGITNPNTSTVQQANPGQRSACLLQSILSADDAKFLFSEKICEQVEYSVWLHGDNASAAPFPGLYAHVEEDVDFGGEVNSASLRVFPSKVEVLELIHSIFVKYCVAMDDLPRVLTDVHFEYALTPFVPSVRREFTNKNLLKPSHMVLESHEAELCEMRTALDTNFRYIGVLQQEHLRCMRAIKVAERESLKESKNRNFASELADSQEDEEDVRLPDLPDLSTSAAAYELAQKTWNRFVEYANTATPILQVGLLLLDQRSFVNKLRCYVSKRVAEMDDALPSIYQQVLTSLLEDVDGRIEKVTKIPTNLAEANAWLVQVMSLMRTHPFRQRLDTKFANLARLRTLMKERGIISLDVDVQDSVRKLELTWESVIETLLLCLSRVEERGSEHRCSVQDIVTKVDDYITGQLKTIVKMFEELPTGCDEEPNKGFMLLNDLKKDEIVQRLEDLVAMDLERKKVAQLFEDYDREHRVLMELPPLQQEAYIASFASTTTSKLSSATMSDKLPTELLLQYIVTSLELRQWFKTWTKLREKWLSLPVTGVHPAATINRIKQFRRRLGYASPKLSRVAASLTHTLPFESVGQDQQGINQEEGLKESSSFARKDFELIRTFGSSIEDMANCNRIFQAINGGAFSEARWIAMHQLLDGVASGSPNELTLRRMKDKCSDAQIGAFMKVCDECIVEEKLHTKMEQARHRLARIEIRVEESNYSVRCEGVGEALAQLDDIAADLKLCLFGQNPELQLCLELSAELEQKVAACEHIQDYQKHWRLRCEATKLHELDEFFSKRFSRGKNASRVRNPGQRSALEPDQVVWQSFLEASHAWSDRLRRIFFVRSRQAEDNHEKLNQRPVLGIKAIKSASTAAQQRLSTTKSMDCTLNDVMNSFEGFDFETNFAACKRGMDLVRTYLDKLRETCPRLYCLDETMMLRLLLRDSDVVQLHQALGILFPRVHRFEMSRAVNQVGSVVDPSAPNGPVRASDIIGTIVIAGIEGIRGDVDCESLKCGYFRFPVAKIGRIKFWFTRLEEEMAFMVQTDMKRALEWTNGDLDTPEFDEYRSLLPQSIATACGLRFTFEMHVLRPDHQQQIYQLHEAVTERLRRLVTLRQSIKTASSCVRFENMLLLSVFQSEIMHRVTELFEQGQHEEAQLFWSLQFQTRAFVENIVAPESTAQPSTGKPDGGRTEKNELFPTNPDFLKAVLSGNGGQSSALTAYCQVAHLQLPLGQEFVGWGRLAIVSPFTQRCSFELFSALNMYHSALIVPYNVQEACKDPTSMLWGIGQMLMRPCIEFSCSPSAGVITIHRLANLMRATSKLYGFLIVRHVMQLSSHLVAVIKERMLQHCQQTASIGNLNSQQTMTNSLVFPRKPGGMFKGASAIFIPLESRADLHRSEFVQSIQTQFRAVAVARPAIQYIVECLLISNGFTTAQIQELNVIQAFEAFATPDLEFGAICAGSTESLIPRVLDEARRLRQTYLVKWNSYPSAKGQSKISLKSLFQKYNGHHSTSVSIEICEGQCIFRRAFTTVITPLLAAKQGVSSATIAERVDAVLATYFPLSEGGRIFTKNKGDEETVAAAVSICLENAFSVSGDCQQYELIMELWRALQVFPAALVYGSAGSGKTTCITALHRALMALEISEFNQAFDDEGRRSTQTNPTAALTQLVILNPQLLTLEKFYTNVAVACSAKSDTDDARKKSDSSDLKWVLVDGEVDSAVLERLISSDNRACASASLLPSSTVFYRSQDSNILSADCPSNNSRLLFESINIASLSPSALSTCWALHVPARCITIAGIIVSWHARWEKQVSFPPHSHGTEAMTIIFKTVDVLISSVCVQFVVEEFAREQTGSIGEVVTDGTLRLGCLSLKQIAQTALALVADCCFEHRSLLLDLSSAKLIELTAFAVLWGFAGHLADPLKQKLEHYVRAKSKEYSETKHLSELSGSLLDANRFEDVWDEIQPKLAGPLSLQAIDSASNGAQSDIHLQNAFDSFSGQVLVLSPAATSMVRICKLLLHSSHSFLLIGPAATGKTSLLRWILHKNSEDEAAKMKIETSLDERCVHGILDWMGLPAAWFRPLGQRSNAPASRAKIREESELFAGRSKHSFVFLDDLDAGGDGAQEAQTEFIRTMLDHRLGVSTKHNAFQSLDKQVGTAMRLDESGPRTTTLPPTLARLMRHFAVFRVPTYTPKELLSIFRVKFQGYFKSNVTRTNKARRLSSRGGEGVGTQQLALEEIVLRASVDFAVEVLSLQHLGHSEHPCLFAFNLHLLNLVLERTLAFAANVSLSSKRENNSLNPASEGTTLVMLGRAHQGWLSELQNVFLSNCPGETASGNQIVKSAESAGDVRGNRVLATDDDEVQRKLNGALQYLSEKYFSVAFRGGGDPSFSISVETLHFMVELAANHVHAPLLQPRLIQLREYLNERMTAASGASRRSSNYSNSSSAGPCSGTPSSPMDMVISMLLEMTPSFSNINLRQGGVTGLKKANQRTSKEEQTALETMELKLVLRSSWGLTQTMHLVHALRQQQQIIVSSTSHSGLLLLERLLRFSCDLHGLKIHVVDNQNTKEKSLSDERRRVLQLVLGAAGVRQERVALLVRQRQLHCSKTGDRIDSNCLADIVRELCLQKLPSFTLLPGGEELRHELVLSCIQSRKKLEIVTEAELMTEFQRRLQQNFRLCILEENVKGTKDAEDTTGQSSEASESLLCWVKTRPSCHWRRLDFTDTDVQRLIPEIAKALVESPTLRHVEHMGPDKTV